MKETLLAPKAEIPTGQKSLVLNPTIEPQRAPVIEAPENPDVIELTISEVDRQTAGPYLDINRCLLCTALRNRGYNLILVGPNYASLDTFDDWKFEDEMRPEALHRINAESAPFYSEGVVGKVVRLHRVHRSVPSA